ncbi:MAG: hypothetical protein RJB26_669 [Pseudomonadota bacterium]|jgi:hypothetical protein
MQRTNDDPTGADFMTVMKWGLFVLATGFLLFGALHVLGVIGTAATAPGRVVNKTLGADNIISSYEWFYDTNAQFDSRRGQIKAHAALARAEEDPKERARLNIELGAMRQSCRDMATKYNANSEKANKSIFKSRGLPETLQLNDCEA